MKVFGFKFGNDDKHSRVPLSVVSPPNEEGSTVIESSTNAIAAHYGMVLDLDSSVKNENDLIRRYREVSQYSTCDSAIEDIINESIIAEADVQPIELNLDDTDLPKSIKSKIFDEFDHILELLNFEENGHDIFRNWYVDGRLYYQILIDENDVKGGIVELRRIDPRKIKRIKNVTKARTKGNVEVVTEIEEYYLYNDKGIDYQASNGIKLSKDSVIFCPSGYCDPNTGMVLSYLHKAIKPTNMLKMAEDSMLIYRIVRAPERRIFYIDVGNLTKLKAEQYVQEIMNKFRNKLIFNAVTGEASSDKKHMSMMEDFWMPRRSGDGGSKGTEITTLAGASNLDSIGDVEYLQRKLYEALNVPLGRLEPQQGFSTGRSTEITREEVKFNKFVARIRKKFSNIFSDALRVQLIVKGIIREDEWKSIGRNIRFDFQKDNFFAELKDNEILMQRITALDNINPYVGVYYSKHWVRKNVLRLSDEDIIKIEQENKESPPEFIPQADDFNRQFSNKPTVDRTPRVTQDGMSMTDEPKKKARERLDTMSAIKADMEDR